MHEIYKKLYTIKNIYITIDIMQYNVLCTMNLILHRLVQEIQ